LDPEEVKVLEGITDWMAINSEGIYSSRPWKIYGEGPSTETKIATGNFNEDKQKALGNADVRFTVKDGRIYAFVMGSSAQATVKALGLACPQQPGKIRQVSLLGYNGALHWKQTDDALQVTLPQETTSGIGVTLKVELV